MSNTLSEYEELLPADLFYRIHKSYLLNCAHIKKILKEDAIQVLTKGNITLPVSRRRFAPLIDFLRNNDFYHE